MTPPSMVHGVHVSTLSALFSRFHLLYFFARILVTLHFNLLILFLVTTFFLNPVYSSVSHTDTRCVNIKVVSEVNMHSIKIIHLTWSSPWKEWWWLPGNAWTESGKKEIKWWTWSEEIIVFSSFSSSSSFYFQLSTFLPSFLIDTCSWSLPSWIPSSSSWRCKEKMDNLWKRWRHENCNCHYHQYQWLEGEREGWMSLWKESVAKLGNYIHPQVLLCDSNSGMT